MILLAPTIILLFVLGLVLGSFGNVLVHRIPRGESIGGRSRCPHCKKKLGMLEIIPVLSFFLLRGRCRGCRRTISARYPLVEIATGMLFIAAFLHNPSIGSLIMAVTLWLMLLIAIVDLEQMEIPDALNFPFIGACVLAAILKGSFFSVAPLLAGGFFGLQWLLSRGRVLGSGDILLALGIGFLLGSWKLLVLWILLSYILGAGVAVVLLLSKRATLTSHIPFAPVLVFGGMVTIFAGEWMLQNFGLTP